MAKADVIEVEGKVTETLPNAMFLAKFGCTTLKFYQETVLK